MILTSKRKLTSSVAILCALMILIGIFPMNLFNKGKAEATNSTRIIYFDTSGNGGWNGWTKDCTMYVYLKGDSQSYNGTDKMTLTDLTPESSDGKIWSYEFDSTIYNKVNFANYDSNNKTPTDSPRMTVTIDLKSNQNNCFILDGGYDANEKYSKTVQSRNLSQSLAGKAINFKDMTGELNTSNITATFSGGGVAEATSSVTDNKVTIPNDVDNNFYTTVEFKNGTTSLGKYNLFNTSSSGVTAISYDENTCNTFYYGVTEKSDGNVSYWGAEPSTASGSINGKKLYLDNTFFDIASDNAPTITINGSTQSFTKDPDDNKVYSYTINTSATQQDIISVIYKNVRYNFLWEDLSKDKLGINGNIAGIYEAYSKGLNLYFDATLSKLSYENSLKNKDEDPEYNATMPTRDSNSKLFAHLFGATDSSTADYEMTKLSSKTVDSNTWSDVYFANISEQDAQKYSKVVFYSSIKKGTWPNINNSLASQTEDLDLPKNTNKTCFYADSSDECIYENSKRSGYWDKVYTIRDAESGKNSTVVDVKESSFSTAKSNYGSNGVKYVDSTFYDYYTDFELNGSNRDDYGISTGGSHRNWVNFRQFDQALSDYYKNKGVSVNDAIYTGHFQPNEYSGSFGFGKISGTLSLYGFSESYRAFISNNNSGYNYEYNKDNEDISTSGHYAYTTQKLVNEQLENGVLKTFDGKAASPYFDEDFLNGNNSKNTKLGEVYKNVSFPFTKSDVFGEGVDYWYFDSAFTTLAMEKDDTSDNYYLANHTSDSDRNWSKNLLSNGKSYADSGSTDTVSTKYGFFPFNYGTKYSTDSAGSTYNYGFGTKLEFKFRLTEDGTVLDGEGNKVDIKFLFSGDDDVWVYIDGKLALDVGGDHGQVTGMLDFANNKAYVSKVKKSANNPDVNESGNITTDPNVSYKGQKINFTQESDFDIGTKTNEHTLTMYYMERGMWESNMRVAFNFPDENQLDVEKQVDTTDVNAMFKNLFNENENFEFLIQNRVTHFGEKAASGTELKTLNFAKDLTGNLSATSASNKFEKVNQGQKNVVHWFAKYKNDNNAYTDKRLGILSADDKQLKDISEMKYLTFKAYIPGNDISLNNIYICLTDTNGKKLYGFLDANKVKDTVLNGNTWVRITVILDKLTAESGFDKSKISTISFQYNTECNIYLDDFTFKNDVTSTSVGFTTQQDQISDYGSAASQKLENAENAQYYKKNSSSASSKGTLGLVDENGNFYLKNKELVTFYDQFRKGSYISLTENLSESQKKLYTTTYTVYEEDSAVTGMSNGSTVKNGSITSLKDVSSTRVEDGRTENTDSDSTAANYNGTKPSGNTFVFRSYANPDDNDNTKLKVKFNNKVNVGSIKITKAQTGNTSLTGKYKFYVEFKNVGGSGLEGANSIVSDVIELGVGESKTIKGIPVGTEYTIHEVDANADNAVLKTVTSNGNNVTISQNIVNGIATHSVTGTVTTSTDEYSYTFNNAKTSTIDLKIEKQWSHIADEDKDKYIPTANSVNFRLLRSSDDSNWEIVPNYEKFTLDSNWKKTITKLDEYVANSDGGDSSTKWKYTIKELDSDDKVIDNNGTTKITAASGDVNYTVTYSTSSDGTLIVNNTRVIQDINMPETGGEGGNPNQFNFVLFGAIAIALAGGLLLLNKKYAFVHKGKSSKEVQ